MLHDEPVSLARWLQPEDLTVLILPVDGDRAPRERTSGTGPSPSWERHDGQVWLVPVDGPIGAVERVARGLRDRFASLHQPWLILEPGAGDAPDPAVVRAFRSRGLSTGVDLRSVRWVRPDGICWTNTDAVVVLELPLTTASESARAMSILRTIGGSDVGWPGEWRVVEAAPLGPSARNRWDLMLAARYLTVLARSPADAAAQG